MDSLPHFHRKIKKWKRMHFMRRTQHGKNTPWLQATQKWSVLQSILNCDPRMSNIHRRQTHIPSLQQTIKSSSGRRLAMQLYPSCEIKIFCRLYERWTGCGFPCPSWWAEGVINEKKWTANRAVMPSSQISACLYIGRGSPSGIWVSDHKCFYEWKLVLKMIGPIIVNGEELPVYRQSLLMKDSNCLLEVSKLYQGHHIEYIAIVKVLSCWSIDPHCKVRLI